MFDNHITEKVAQTAGKAKDFVAAHKKGAVAVAVVAVLGISGVGFACASGVFDTGKDAPPAEESADKVIETAHINVTADSGWTADSTPAIVHIESADEHGDVDFYHALAPSQDNIGSYEVELKVGTYKVDVISPVNNDGSAYELFDTGEAQTLEVVETDDEKEVEPLAGVIEADGESEAMPIDVQVDNTVDIQMKLITADQVTDEMLTAIAEDTEDAIAKGDDTLKGDAGKAVLETLDRNIEANPNADAAKAQSDQAMSDAKVDEASVETPKEQSTGKPSGKPESKPADKPSGNGGGAAKPSAQAHTHHWKDHTATKQVWVSNVVPVYEDRQVQTGTNKVSLGVYWHCSGCGAEMPREQSRDHIKAHLEAGTPDNGYTFEKFKEEPIYETQKVQVGTRDDGHYETQTYVDYRYCDCGARQ